MGERFWRGRRWFGALPRTKTLVLPTIRRAGSRSQLIPLPSLLSAKEMWTHSPFPGVTHIHSLVDGGGYERAWRSSPFGPTGTTLKNSPWEGLCYNCSAVRLPPVPHPASSMFLQVLTLRAFPNQLPGDANTHLKSLLPGETWLATHEKRDA